MKPISETAGRALNSLTSAAPENCEKPLPARRAMRVWVRLHQMYGDRFLREFGSEPNDTWAAAIDRMGDEEVKRALVTLAEKGSPHPPALPEFVAASKPETGSPRYLGADPINYTELRIAGMLPQPPKVARDFASLRAALKGQAE